MLLAVCGLAPDRTAGAGAARAVCLRLRVSPGDHDLPARYRDAALSCPPASATNVGQEPSFLALDPAAKFLFAVNETDPGRVRSFAVNQATGALTPINDVPSMGSITAHLSTDRTGRWLAWLANYGGREAGDDRVDSDRRRRPAWRGGRHAGVRPGNDGPSNQGGSRQSLRVSCRSRAGPRSRSSCSIRPRAE